MEKVNLIETLLFLVIIFKIKYEQLLKVYNGNQCVIVLIKNVTTTSKGDQYLKAQQYIILTKVVDETTQAYLLQLHNKLNQVFNLHSKR